MTHIVPFALFIRGEKDRIFSIADELGFEEDMSALAVSIFEDGPDTLHIQALYDTKSEADAVLTRYSQDNDLECFVTQLEDEDWVTKSQKGLPPVIAGPFCVFGEHDRENIPKDIKYPILVEAGLAFGTGHHGTTKGCLLAYNRLIEANVSAQNVLDLGCGAGTLAIAYAKASGKPVLATDIDPDAVAVTKENAQLNGVGDLVTSVIADGFDHPILKGKTYDLIFANILAEPLMALAPDITAALEMKGRVILSGILDEKSKKVAACYQAHGLEISYFPSVEGWTNLLGQKLT